MKITLAAAIALAIVPIGTQASAATVVTGPAGSGAAFSTYQPSLALTAYIQSSGYYPSRSDGMTTSAYMPYIGQQFFTAASYVPNGNYRAEGQEYSIGDNIPLFSLYGNSYGGNGFATFDVPDLSGKLVVGGSPSSVGSTAGSATATLTTETMPTHVHATEAGVTTAAGGNQPIDTRQPTLTMTYAISSDGRVNTYGGNSAPSGTVPLDGRLLSIRENLDLFSHINYLYGGTPDAFRVPDLQGRTIVGTAGGYFLGQSLGSDSTFLTFANLPAHTHDVPGQSESGSTGWSAPIDSYQNSLALNYAIAVNGLYPSRDGNGDAYNFEPNLAEIAAFAGTLPSGWMLAQGQLLNIYDNQALFSLIGITYGGDGQTTFALPDLRGRSLIGTGDGFQLGSVIGNATVALTEANLPVHVHTAPAPVAAVPESGTWAMMIGGFGLMGWALRRRRSQRRLLFA